MSINNIDFIFYSLLILGLFGLGWLSIWIKRKYQITKEEVELLQLILETVDYITQNVEFKYKKGASKIVKYCIEALEFIEKYEEIKDIEFKKELVKEKALDICEREGLDLQDGTIEIVDKIVDYIFDNYVK